jgi:calcineurin-like phosphoesterase family protein
MYYAIGDVHGHHDLLCLLYSKILTHHAENVGDDDFSIVLLGDLIDRGPDSRAVLEFAAALDPERHVVLPGNHELMCANALRAMEQEGPDAFEVGFWLSNGGDETLSSYCRGVRICDDISIEDAFDTFHEFHGELIDMLAYRRPTYHLDEERQLLFVHAGVLMNRRLQDHSREELLWTRNSAFLDDKNSKWIEPDLLVIHGHSPTTKPSVRHRRIGIDTGAYVSGVLTACGIESAASKPVFIQTRTNAD